MAVVADVAAAVAAASVLEHRRDRRRGLHRIFLQRAHTGSGTSVRGGQGSDK